MYAENPLEQRDFNKKDPKVPAPIVPLNVPMNGQDRGRPTIVWHRDTNSDFDNALARTPNQPKETQAKYLAHDGGSKGRWERIILNLC
ncbi:MAG: hypothetical protein CM15mP71_6760 [Candidatus Poseidoniales archaeon]|nr:MAG: hypothetical protein CM15mP71_6760 [Candidatus Poseidoniales archaeon]